ncbi:MAG: hypothetical protein WCF78_01870 [archaeon]
MQLKKIPIISRLEKESKLNSNNSFLIKTQNKKKLVENNKKLEEKQKLRTYKEKHRLRTIQHEQIIKIEWIDQLLKRLPEKNQSRIELIAIKGFIQKINETIENTEGPYFKKVYEEFTKELRPKVNNLMYEFDYSSLADIKEVNKKILELKEYTLKFKQELIKAIERQRNRKK